MARIYTRSGDKGKTSLVHGDRVDKNHVRVEAYGTCDEANSMIGLAISYLKNEAWEEKEKFIEALNKVQTVLFHVGAELSTPKGKEVYWQLKKEHVDELEKQIDEWQESLQPLKQFILPSGHPCGAALHVARTVVRRAERVIVGIDDFDNEIVLSYINRLSDYLFVAARYVNQSLGEQELTLNPDV